MSAKFIKIDTEHVGQRVDNFLHTRLKGVPKSRIYKALRKGEVRVNKGRVKAEYKLQLDDEVRIPPLRVAQTKAPHRPGQELADELESRILIEDDQLIVIDKPAGLPVHGGTNISAGLIEMLRGMRPKQSFLELVHRIDRGTSGCLVIAKKRSVLLELHRLLSERKVKKQYVALVKGRWERGDRTVKAALLKQMLPSGERIVRINDEGKSAETWFKPLRIYKDKSLIACYPKTGRTHQLRVHLASIGHPIIGDDKYGDEAFNRSQQAQGIYRMCLHSSAFACKMQMPERLLGICVQADFV